MGTGSKYTIRAILNKLQLWYSILATLCVLMSIWTFSGGNTQTDADWIYRIGFLVAAVPLIRFAAHPRIGKAADSMSILGIIAAVRILDIWQSWLFSNNSDIINFRIVTLASLSWSFFFVSWRLIDLFENKLLDRLIAYGDSPQVH